MSETGDRTDKFLKLAAGLCFIMAGGIALFILYSAATGGISNRDPCEWRTWGHCAGRRATPFGRHQDVTRAAVEIGDSG